MHEILARTPLESGYFFPAEWEKHKSTWLSWPHKEASWPGKIDSIYPVYIDFIKYLSQDERVNINVNDEAMRAQVSSKMTEAGINLQKIRFFIHPTNDAWCRDHGPTFLINPKRSPSKIIVDWNYNAWGDKYPPYDLDDIIPSLIGQSQNIPVFHPGVIMEGGSVEFNGQGTILTTSACLLNKNRNPHLNQKDIEGFLRNYYGVDQILWLKDGILGDDTDGHIDDLTRFFNSDSVLTVIEEDKSDENYLPLQENLKTLKKLRLLNDKQLNIVELPMPDPVFHEDQRLPASYANFYIANNKVIVPLFHCKKDEIALEILQQCFPDRKIIGMNSVDLIWGLGSFHCLSQQEPSV
ncbi:agmatine deiminase family protein [soil metagenome]